VYRSIKIEGNAMENFVITIARGFGSGGKEIGTKLAEELGIPCYENQILKMASERSGLNEQLFYQTDEKIRGNSIINWIKKISYNTLISPEDHDFVMDLNMYHFQSKIIKELATTQSCIIIGKCADDVLKDYSNVISLYVEAPRDACLESIVNKMGIGNDEAERLIIKTDRYRSDYYKYYTGGKSWTNPTNYDLVLNSQRIGRENCVQLIQSYLGVKKFIS
jgi:cytidylate kinase